MVVKSLAFFLVGAGCGILGLLLVQRFHHDGGHTRATRAISGSTAAAFINEQLPSYVSYKNSVVCPPRVPVVKGRIFHCQVVVDQRIVGAEMRIATGLGVIELKGLYGWPGECPVAYSCFSRP